MAQMNQLNSLDSYQSNADLAELEGREPQPSSKKRRIHSLFGQAGLRSGSINLKGSHQESSHSTPDRAKEIDNTIGSILSLDQINESVADELNPELAQKNSERLKQTVNVVQDRIQRRADKERRIWIDQKTFIAKEKFNFDKYD